MAKKNRKPHTANRSGPPPRQEQVGSQPLLKDLLDAQTLGKLKAQADSLKHQEVQRQEEVRRQQEQRRQEEQRQRDNEFGYLLENSDPDWRKHK